MSPAQLAALAQDSRMDIGSHTMTHPTLAVLSPAEQARELQQSKRVLEQVIGRRVRAFSYPHGAATPATGAFVRAAGYSLACASHNDLAGANSDVYLLPRFWPGDVDGPAFARWLHRWLGGWWGGWVHG
jgi:peptidoglycan/xylan/chitin deacetylase (PgdA/CDA1 family)